MPADASIYGLQQPVRINTPFDVLPQMLQIRAQQEAAAGLREQRQGLAEQRRTQADAAQREAARTARLMDLFTNNPKPTRDDILKADPSEHGINIAKGIEALQDGELKRYKDVRAVTNEAIAGLDALPEPMRVNGYGAMRQAFLARGWATPDQIPEQYDPAFIASIKTSLLSPEKQHEIANPKPIEVGGALVKPNAAGGYDEVYTPKPKPEKVTYGAPQTQMVGGRRSLVRPGSDGRMYDMNLKPVAGEAIAPEPREGNKPSYEWAQTTEGTRLLTPDEIRKQGATKPIAATDKGKYKNAEPVLSAISELSEKINTGQGIMAKMGGGAAKIAAKANYDDDVAEFQALVEGFTPLMARALGHTGVLTQQDVDSVKALFPQPGNSKTLRDRKIARVRDIFNKLEGADADGATGGPKTATTPKGETPEQRIKRLVGGG